MEHDPVVVVPAGQKHKVIDSFRGGERVEGDGHGALVGRHLGRIALGRIDDHGGRAVETLGFWAGTVSCGDLRGHGILLVMGEIVAMVDVGFVQDGVWGCGGGAGPSYDTAMVTEIMRWRTVGGTPEELPSVLILSTTLVPEVTLPKSV